MTLDDALGTEQAEPDTAAIVFRQLEKAVKNRFQLIVRNAFACVGHGTDDVVLESAPGVEQRSLAPG